MVARIENISTDKSKINRNEIFRRFMNQIVQYFEQIPHCKGFIYVGCKEEKSCAQSLLYLGFMRSKHDTYTYYYL